MEAAAMAHTQSLSLLPRTAHSFPFIELRQSLPSRVAANSHKRVYVGCRCYMNGEVSITVRDEGRGFHSNAVPDPTLLENLLFTHGRGIYLMKTLMDEVSFEGGGSVVRMRKNSNSCATSQGNQDDNLSHNQHLRHRG